MVEVFKTNVQLDEEAATIAGRLSSLFPSIKINFDLDDCDKVLRIEGDNFIPCKVMEILNLYGYYCQIME